MKRRNVIHCKALQRIATRCNMLQHTATRCNTLQHVKAVDLKHHNATHCHARKHIARHGKTLQHTATHCPTLQRAATCKFNLHVQLIFSDRVMAHTLYRHSNESWHTHQRGIPMRPLYSIFPEIRNKFAEIQHWGIGDQFEEWLSYKQF